jgi:hypothetical protein
VSLSAARPLFLHGSPTNSATQPELCAAAVEPSHHDQRRLEHARLRRCWRHLRSSGLDRSPQPLLGGNGDECFTVASVPLFGSLCGQLQPAVLSGGLAALMPSGMVLKMGRATLSTMLAGGARLSATRCTVVCDSPAALTTAARCYGVATALLRWCQRVVTAGLRWSYDGVTTGLGHFWHPGRPFGASEPRPIPARPRDD